MKTQKLACGCKFEVGDRERWIEYCPEHRLEVETLHHRALAEHNAQMGRHTETRAKAVDLYDPEDAADELACMREGAR